MNQSEFKSELKKVLSKVNDKTILSNSILARLGFTVKRGGKHFIMTYHGMMREHKFVVSATSSDRKSISNLVSVVMNNIRDDYRMVAL